MLADESPSVAGALTRCGFSHHLLVVLSPAPGPGAVVSIDIQAIILSKRKDRDMAGKYDDLARAILENVGGKENVNSVAH